MMTLNEAIRHAEEKACGNTGCAEEYRQLAEWLKELKELRFLQGAWRTINKGLLDKLSRYDKLIQDLKAEVNETEPLD